MLNEKETKAELNKIHRLIKKQQASTNQSVKQKQSSLAELNKSVTDLTGQLKQKAQGRTDLLKQIDDVEKQLKTANNSDSSEMEKQLEYQRLTSKLNKLTTALGL